MSIESDVVRVVQELDEAQTGAYLDYLSQVWWNKGRTHEQNARAVGNSLIIGLVDGSGTLLACARLVTDYVLKALVLDLVVAPQARGRGLGKKLMRAIIEHDDLKDIEDFELYCAPELAGWYRQFGFELPNTGIYFLRRRAGDLK